MKRLLRQPRSLWITLSLAGIIATIFGVFIWVEGRSPTAPLLPTSVALAPSTQRMVTWLRQKRLEEQRDAAILSEDNGASPWFANRPESIPTLIKSIAETSSLRDHITLRLRLAQELLWSGKNEESLQALEELGGILGNMGQQIGPEGSARLMATIRHQAATCFLRIAERDNCICDHNKDSCIFPIQGGGIHTRPQGSRSAIEVLADGLREDSQDLGARWLLNLAYMTLGEHPDKVPPEWLIPASVFNSQRDLGRFPSVAKERGVDVFGLAGGCALEDFDGDGALDLVTSGWSLDEQLRFFKNLGNGSFEERTAPAGILGITGGLNVSHADYQNDGHPDILVLRGGWLADRGAYPPSLLRNRGNGTFEDVTLEAGLLAYHPGQVGIWADFDNDGWVDLFLGHENDKQGGHPSLLYHNNRNGTFTECAAASGLGNLGFVKGAAWGDIDQDGFPELHVSRLGDKNLLFHNGGQAASTPAAPFAWSFRDITDKAGVGDPPFSFSSWFWDYDNDGWLDLFVAGFSKRTVGDVAALYLGKQVGNHDLPRLYRNNHDGTFADVTHQTRLDRTLLIMGANFGDLDNDGYLDLYLGTGTPDLTVLMPNRMFRNAGGKVFEDVTTAGGFGHLQKGHGIAFGDIDADGDQDIYAVLGGWYQSDGFRNALFLNPGHGNHWITLRLEGTRTNRSAIGARIELTLPAAAGSRKVYATVGTGGSFGSSSLQQEIGLGTAPTIEAIEITWPTSGKKQVLRDVKADQVLKIREE